MDDLLKKHKRVQRWMLVGVWVCASIVAINVVLAFIGSVPVVSICAAAVSTASTWSIWHSRQSVIRSHANIEEIVGRLANQG